MRKFVISGGPCCGKTTLIEELQRRGYAAAPEIARGIIAAEQQALAQDPSHTPVLPWTNLEEFQRRVFERMLMRDANAAGDVVFFDYGLGDTVAFCIEGDVPIPDGSFEAVEESGYEKVFLLDRLPFYHQDAQRKEDDARARRIHDMICDTYMKFGFDVVVVPVMPVEERVAFVLEKAGLPKVFKQD